MSAHRQALDHIAACMVEYAFGDMNPKFTIIIFDPSVLAPMNLSILGTPKCTDANQWFSAIHQCTHTDSRVHPFHLAIKLSSLPSTFPSWAHQDARHQTIFPSQPTNAQTLTDLSSFGHIEATNTAMANLMGKSTAKYCGYTDLDGPEVSGAVTMLPWPP